MDRQRFSCLSALPIVITYWLLFSVRTSHPATGVEHCIYVNFFRGGERNLVVAGANIIKVYQLSPEGATKVIMVNNSRQSLMVYANRKMSVRNCSYPALTHLSAWPSS